MEIAKHYDSATLEDKWYKEWLEKGYFNSVPDEREPYTIVIPPPNVTGVLHMGHMLNNTIQDVLIRKARMEGKNALWVPGTDHASIATEAKVVAKLREEGLTKKDLTRDEFLEKAWEWKEEHGGIILEQLKKLGASCDWSRTRFTMEDKLSEAVIKVFVDLYNKGLIYRGIRMVNWDPVGMTAVSDEEVIHKDVNAKLYYVEYRIENSDETVTIATTRPETILGDTAICVNPNDERYAALKDKKALVPLIDRPIPFIYDDYVDMEFGTGALKVTPAHDINDYELGVRHNLETIDILNDDGTLNESAQLFVGQDREVARKNIVAELEQNGLLVKTEEIEHAVGFSERTHAVIEPKLSMQWFFKMEEMAKPALDYVMDDTIKFYPSKFKATYKHWMENVRDWCISRQLWWGQRIPAWYDEEGKIFVAETTEEVEKLAGHNNLRQDEDVLDTWFSSWLWPISVFDGMLDPDNEDINYYYPTNDLITAPDILFFWVARMIMSGYEYRGQKPFNNVYLTGMVRDEQGRKMSKQLGNSPNPLDLIQKYSADGVRTGMLFCSPAGNDLLFDVKLCDQGRSFCNKIWNALRLIKGWEVDEQAPQEESSALAVAWFNSKFNDTLSTINDHYSKFRISDALMTVYKLIWDDFCSWYLESVKPGYEKPIDAKTYRETITIFEGLLKVLHPFMPFISEEIWHLIGDRGEKESIVIAEWPKAGEVDKNLLKDFDDATELIKELRTVRKENNIPFKESIRLIAKIENGQRRTFDPIVSKLINLEEMVFSMEKPENSQTLVIGSVEYFVPMTGKIDNVAESKKLQSELDYTKGFLKSVLGKLSNEKFVNNAPEKVIAIERKKQSEAEERITVLEEQLKSLAN
ncbi:MAG: valine--tRNA ligase [Flavobacteriales bacterium]|nr:valine--tRNA ligase [Flavobacteriales bacterium]